jgi:ectoine hydroxylase-related dioxygenase (phytanoyl-CoA dioxygenase family)
MNTRVVEFLGSYNKQIKSYDENGFLVFRNTISESLIDEMRAFITQKEAEKVKTFTLLSKRRAIDVHDSLIARKILQAFCAKNKEILIEVLGSSSLVTDISVLISEANNDAQILHTDSPCRVSEECNLIVPLEPLIADNGPTEYVPGSHWRKKNKVYQHTVLRSFMQGKKEYVDWCLKNRSNFKLAVAKEGKIMLLKLMAYPVFRLIYLLKLEYSSVFHQQYVVKDEDIKQFIADKGDALLYSSSLIHRGGKNSTQNNRYVLSALIKENRNNRKANVKYQEDDHNDYFTTSTKNCGTLHDYLYGNW